MKKCKYFKLYELLPPAVYRDEDTGWSLIDDKLKDVIDWIRELLGVPLIVNTWYQDGNRSNSGFRVPESPVGVKFSAHKEGKAVDMISATLTAEQMRKVIKENEENLPHPIRIESGVSWLHVDTRNDGKKGKIIFFKA